MAEVRIENVTKSFGAVDVIPEMNLTIEDGSFTVLVGPSGCGKSTLLRLIAGLEDVTSGTVSIGGEDVTYDEPSDRGIAMVFQSYALYPHMTVRQNIGFGLRLAKKSKAEIAARVEEAAEILQLGPLLDRKPRQLSGGQRQRVAIGRSIVRHPKVFLFDEPLSNLDAALRTQMRVELAELHGKLDATMVYVTHDQVEAMTMADRIVIMNQGRVEQVGAPMEVYNNPASTFVAGFIGSPKMNLINGEVAAGFGATNARHPARTHPPDRRLRPLGRHAPARGTPRLGHRGLCRRRRRRAAHGPDRQTDSTPHRPERRPHTRRTRTPPLRRGRTQLGDSMTVIVTGGSGGAGNAVIEDLVARDIPCINIDITRPKRELCPFHMVDLTDYRALHKAMEGGTALVHFAGNPHPDDTHWVGADRFENNTVALFNAFNAAQDHGINRVVWASSETVFGFPFEFSAPKEVPVTETSLRQPQNGYAMSKAISEDLADLMALRYGMVFIGLRLSNVLYDDEAAVPSHQKIPGYWDDTSSRKFNLWGYIDSRDTAKAVRLALEADITGSEVFNIGAPDTIMKQETRALVAEHFPDAVVAEGLGQYEAMMNCDKARDMLGWEPDHTWSSVLGMSR